MIRSSIIFPASLYSTSGGGVITAVSPILKSCPSTGASQGISILLAALKYLFNAAEYIFILWSSLIVLSLNILSISKLLADVTFFSAGRECFFFNSFSCSNDSLSLSCSYTRGSTRTIFLACSIKNGAKYAKNRSNQGAEKSTSL